MYVQSQRMSRHVCFRDTTEADRDTLLAICLKWCMLSVWQSLDWLTITQFVHEGLLFIRPVEGVWPVNGHFHNEGVLNILLN